MSEEQRAMIEVVKWQTIGVALVVGFLASLALMCWRLGQMAEYVVTAAV